MDVHRGAAAKPPRRPRRKRQDNLVVVKVDPLIMEEALRLADGDASRLEIVSAGEVIVH